jgi:hypothetical protein
MPPPLLQMRHSVQKKMAMGHKCHDRNRRQM